MSIYNLPDDMTPQLMDRAQGWSVQCKHCRRWVDFESTTDGECESCATLGWEPDRPGE